MEFTARNAAKYVVTAVIAIKTEKFAKDTITDYTEFEQDDMIVKIGSHLIGWGVSSKLKPVTDAAVDKTADFISAKRQELKDKKETKKTEE